MADTTSEVVEGVGSERVESVGTVSPGATIATAWSARTPAAMPDFRDDRVTAYRHPLELQALLLGLGGIALVLIVARVTGTFNEIGAGIGVVWLTLLVTAIQQKPQQLASGIEVTASYLPRIHKIAQELRERFSMPEVRVMMSRDLALKTSSSGFATPYVISVGTTLADTLTDEELRFMLGREMGHVKLGHTRVNLLLGGNLGNHTGMLGMFTQIRDLLFAGFFRAQAMSADRIGVVACRGMNPAVSTFAKLALSAAQVKTFRLEQLEAQVRELGRGHHRVGGMMVLLQAREAPLIYRLQALIGWAGLPTPEQPVATTGGAGSQPAATDAAAAASAAKPEPVSSTETVATTAAPAPGATKASEAGPTLEAEPTSAPKTTPVA